MKNPAELAILRKLYGQPVPADPQESALQQIRPGLWRKVYGRSKKRHMLRPTRFDLRKEVAPLRSGKEITKAIDNRPLLELRGQIDKLIEQIGFRARVGDYNAIETLIVIARELVALLETIETAQPKALQSIAKESINWPVLLSRNRRDITRAQEHVMGLKVGERAPTPRQPGQKFDPNGFWIQLAQTAFKACRDIKVSMPHLKAHCIGAKRIRKSFKFSGTPVSASYYFISPTDCILITDWEQGCTALSFPVTRENLRRWWHPIKYYVLEYWHRFPQEYKEALRQIGHPEEEEWRQRNLAVDRVEQSFRDLFHLR